LVPWCEEKACEEEIKRRSKEESEKNEDAEMTAQAKSINCPLDQKPVPEGTLCLQCKNHAKKWTVFGRSY
jgi:prolyl-tRNA synthetase